MALSGWYPDPSGAHELRFWDGRGWTDHVADRGVAGLAPIGPAVATPRAPAPQPQPRPAAGPPPPQPPAPVPWQGGGTLFSEPILLVDQLSGQADPSMTTTFLDARRRPLAFARQQPPSALFPDSRNYLLVTDPGGKPLFACDLHQPERDRACLVRGDDEREVGRILKGEVPGRVMDLWLPSGLAAYVVEHPTARPAALFLDANGVEIARMTDMPAHSFNMGRMHVHDYYTIHVAQPLSGPLGVLMVAAILYADV